MKKDQIKLAVISDIHLAHPRVPTKDILERLSKKLFNDRVLASLDMVVIAGDFFDGLVDASDDTLSLIKLWIAKILVKCFQTNTKIYVLHGTRSHDRHQTRLFCTVDEILTSHCASSEYVTKLTYVEDLCVLEDTEFGLKYLFVPDDLPGTAEDTLRKVKQLIPEGEKVDFAFMHGMFRFQLDIEEVRPLQHDEQEYLELVKYLIFIGHIHTSSQYSRIIAQGSFDRLAQGEEEDKGYVKAQANKDGSFTTEFVVNENAHTFVTIDCDDLELSDTLIKIADLVKDLRTGSYIRLRADKSHPLFSNRRVFSEKWPDYFWDYIAQKEKSDKSNLMVVEKQKIYVPLVLNQSNLKEKTTDRLGLLKLTQFEINHALHELDQILQGISL